MKRWACRWPQVLQIVNESTRQAVENPAIRALKEGVIVGLANHTVLIAKDGTERPIDDSAAPIRVAKTRAVFEAVGLSTHQRPRGGRAGRMPLNRNLIGGLEKPDSDGGLKSQPGRPRTSRRAPKCVPNRPQTYLRCTFDAPKTARRPTTPSGISSTTSTCVEHP